MEKIDERVTPRNVFQDNNSLISAENLWLTTLKN